VLRFEQIQAGASWVGHGAGANIKERAFTDALQFTYFARKLMN
jgi:prolyl oligopeptidase PreP (S9A serine peptidase family)